MDLSVSLDPARKVCVGHLRTTFIIHINPFLVRFVFETPQQAK